MLKPLLLVPFGCKGYCVVVVDENLIAGLNVADGNNTHDVAKPISLMNKKMLFED